MAKKSEELKPFRYHVFCFINSYAELSIEISNGFDELSRAQKCLKDQEWYGGVFDCQENRVVQLKEVTTNG